MFKGFAATVLCVLAFAMVAVNTAAYADDQGSRLKINFGATPWKFYRGDAINGQGIATNAGAVIDAAIQGTDDAAPRVDNGLRSDAYAAALVESRGRRPVFFLNVPSTWQTAAPRGLYLGELRRLGGSWSGWAAHCRPMTI